MLITTKICGLDFYAESVNIDAPPIRWSELDRPPGFSPLHQIVSDPVPNVRTMQLGPALCFALIHALGQCSTAVTDRCCFEADH